MHFIFFVLGTAIFILSFHTSLFKGLSVFFYRGVSLLTFTALLMIILLLYFRKTRFGALFTIRDIVLSVVLIFCVNLLFFTHVPVTAERSLSVFLLGYMNEHSTRVFSKDEITRIFIEKYVIENENVRKRIDEQLVSKNIAEEGGVYSITRQGKIIMNFYNFISRLFVVDKKNLSP